MPEITQYTLSHRELLELMIKSVGVHSGKWMLTISFGFGAVNIGNGPEDAQPSAVVQVQKIGMQVAPPDAPDSLVLDAAKVNPPTRGTARRKT